MKMYNKLQTFPVEVEIERGHCDVIKGREVKRCNGRKRQLDQFF